MIDNQNVEIKVTLKPTDNEPIEKGTLPGE